LTGPGRWPWTAAAARSRSSHPRSAGSSRAPTDLAITRWAMPMDKLSVLSFASPRSWLLTLDMLSCRLVAVGGATQRARRGRSGSRCQVRFAFSLLYLCLFDDAILIFEHLFCVKEIDLFFPLYAGFRDCEDDAAAGPEGAGDDSREASEVRVSHLSLIHI
ncbi:hypothetical protein BAE44_0025384, partial [Dichanthelium oligosanthes]